MSGDRTPGSPLHDPHTFLHGAALFLRGVELGDAAFATAWYPAPFPLPREVIEERIKAEEPHSLHTRTQRLIACRRTDHRPMGSVTFDVEDSRVAWLAVHADPLLG